MPLKNHTRLFEKQERKATTTTTGLVDFAFFASTQTCQKTENDHHRLSLIVSLLFFIIQQLPRKPARHIHQTLTVQWTGTRARIVRIFVFKTLIKNYSSLENVCRAWRASSFTFVFTHSNKRAHWQVKKISALQLIHIQIHTHNVCAKKIIK